MKNTKLIKKYEMALDVAVAVEKLECHVIRIKNTLDILNSEEYTPTTLDEIWVDYFLDMNKEELKKINKKVDMVRPPEYILDTYNRIIEFTYKKYEEKKATISRGIITREMIDWLIDRLYLNDATDDQLNEYWFAVDRFFRNKMMEKDIDGEWQWKQGVDIMWYMDCDSAWKEVINSVARSRRGE